MHKRIATAALGVLLALVTVGTTGGCTSPTAAPTPISAGDVGSAANGSTGNGSTDDGPTGTDSGGPVDATDPAVEPRPGGSSDGVAARDLSGTPPVWWSGFEIELVRASVDSATGRLSIDATVRNTAAIPTGLGATRTQIAVRSGGRVTALASGTDMIPVDESIDTTLVFAPLPDGFSLDGSELVLGAAKEHQATFPLDGGTPQARAPIKVPGAATIRNAHTQARFDTSQIRLIPASCSGTNTQNIQYLPLREDRMTLELVGTLRSPSASVGGVLAQRARATLAGGPAVVSDPGLSDVLGVDAPPREDVHLCFPVPFDASGRVALAFDTRLVGEAMTTATGALTLP